MNRDKWFYDTEGTIHQEVIQMLNVYILINGKSKYKKKITSWIIGRNSKSIIIIRDFKTLHPVIERKISGKLFTRDKKIKTYNTISALTPKIQKKVMLPNKKVELHFSCIYIEIYVTFYFAILNSKLSFCMPLMSQNILKKNLWISFLGYIKNNLS